MSQLWVIAQAANETERRILSSLMGSARWSRCKWKLRSSNGQNTNSAWV